MKQKIWIALILAACILVLAGCKCEHEWVEADCDSAKTCTLCEETEGAPLGHSWLAATCEAPKTCENCGATEGEAKGHFWEEATCEEAKTCNVCNQKDGNPLGHTWEEATTELPKTCSVCQVTEGEPLDDDPRFTTASTKELQGLWSCNVTLTGKMLEMEGYLESLECTLFYNFGSNGEGNMYIEFKDRFAVLEAIKQLTLDVTYQTYAAMGYGMSATYELIKETTGMSTEEFVDKSIESMDMEELFGMFFTDFLYYVEDGKVYMTFSNPMEEQELSWENDFESTKYTLEDGVLIMEEEYLDDPDVPLEWTRVEK